MPIDNMILDPMLGTFRNMMKDVIEKGLTGPDVDAMQEAMNRMEQLGQEHSDINTFNGALMQENLFGKFSEFYSKALANAAKAQSENGSGSGSGSYDDSALLKQSIDGLKNAITEIKNRYNEAVESSVDNSIETAILNDPEMIIKGIQDVIDLGEQPGMTFPRFLRLQIETGLSKAMEGAVVARKGQEYTLNITKVNPVTPYHIEREQLKLEKFDELASKNKFNIPNLKELSYCNRDIDIQFDTKIAIWKNITERWESLLFDLSFWSLSYCSFAPHIEPWMMSHNPKAAVIKTQKTTPGIFKQKERLFEKYFGLKFNDIFSHETFKWAVKYNFIGYSQEYVDFLRYKIYHECKPFNDLSSSLINEKAAFYNEKREGNPEATAPAKRMRDFYDMTFETGLYTKKYGEIKEAECNAKPWKL